MKVAMNPLISILVFLLKLLEVQDHLRMKCQELVKASQKWYVFYIYIYILFVSMNLIDTIFFLYCIINHCYCNYVCMCRHWQDDPMLENQPY